MNSWGTYIPTAILCGVLAACCWGCADPSEDTAGAPNGDQGLPWTGPAAEPSPRSAEALPDPNGCNGWSQLCGRRFDQVAYATTHNAMANTDRGFHGPNQHHSIARQLAAGVRALMLDTYLEDGQTMLCHGVCLAGSQPLVEGLAEIEAFLAANPREVVTIIFESYISAQQTQQAFEDSGLNPHLYHRPEGQGQDWPTLEEMIDAGERLVVLTDREGSQTGWHLDVWSLAWETHYSARSAEDFTCNPNRGDTNNALFIFNHFLTNPIGLPELAEQVNHNPLLGQRAEQCQNASGKLPNFITVDFYSIGDVLTVVNALNGVH